MTKIEEKKLIDLIENRQEAGWNGKNSCKNMSGNIDAYIWDEQPNLNASIEEDTESQFVNFPMIHIETIASLMNDMPIEILVDAQAPGYELDAKIYEVLVKHMRATNRDEEARDQLQKYAILLGTGCYKIWHEDKAGRKTIMYDVRDTRKVVCDPSARNMKMLRWIIETVSMNQEEIKKIYPKYNFKKREGIESDLDIKNENEQYNQSEEDGSKIVDIRIMTWKDGDIYRRTVSSGGQILEDVDSECDYFPYVFAPFISLPDRIYGLDLFTYLKLQSAVMNKNVKRMQQIINKAAIGNLYINSTFIDKNTITNKDNQLISMQAGANDIRGMVLKDPPPPIPDTLITFAKLMEDYMQKTAGTMDISGLTVGSNMPSGKSIEEASQIAQTRLRQAVRNIKRLYGDMGRIAIRMMHKLMDVETVVKITGADAQSVVEVLYREDIEAQNALKKAGASTPEEFQIGMQIFAREKGLSVKKNTNNSIYLGIEGQRLGNPDEFAVKVAGGLDIQHGKLDTAQQANMLLQAGASLGQPLIDPITYMEATGFQYKEKVMERLPMFQEFRRFQMMKQKEAEEAQKNGQNSGGAVPAVSGMQQGGGV